MSERSEPPREVLVVLDPDFGERLRGLWPGRAVWIVKSPVNDPVVSDLLARAPGYDHLSGITVVTDLPTTSVGSNRTSESHVASLPADTQVAYLAGSLR